jgi:hypothetical protein
MRRLYGGLNRLTLGRVGMAMTIVMLDLPLTLVKHDKKSISFHFEPFLWLKC